MLIIVPYEIKGLKKIEKNLEKFSLDYEKSFDCKNVKEVHLWLPKFKIETSIELNETLKKVRLILRHHEYLSSITVNSIYYFS